MKIKYLSFLFILFLIGYVSATSCSGKTSADFLVKSSVTYTFDDGRVSSITDSCSTFNQDVVNDYICQNNWYSLVSVDCKTFGSDYSCIDGACKRNNLVCTSFGHDYNPGDEFCPFGYGNTACQNHLIPFIGTHIFSCNGVKNPNIQAWKFESDCSTSATEWSCGTGKFCYNGDCVACVTSSDCLQGSCVSGSCQGSNVCTSFGHDYNPGDEFCPFGYGNTACQNHLIPFIGTHIFSCNGVKNPNIQAWKFESDCSTSATEWSCGTGKFCYNGDCVSNETNSSCKLSISEDCGKGLFNVCDKAECENCGFYYVPKNSQPITSSTGTIGGCIAGGSVGVWGGFVGFIPGCVLGGLVGLFGGSAVSPVIDNALPGTCVSIPPTPTCQTCEQFAMSSIFGSFSKSSKCEAKKGSAIIGFVEGLINGLFGKVLPNDYPQTYNTCAFSFVKIALVFIVLVFGFLFSLDIIPRYVKVLRGNNKKLIRIFVCLGLSILLAYLVYIIFWAGIILFVIITAIKIGVKKYLP